MRRNKAPGLWAILIFAVALLVQPHSFFAKASTGQTQPEASKSKPTSPVKISGKVVDRDGKGIANAEVTFAGPTKAKTTTDSEGSFTYAVAPGKYKITVKSGAKSKTIDAEVGSDSSELSLILG